jgi:SAM-dependent methyltransferase
MILGEIILNLLSNSPDATSPQGDLGEWEIDNALSLLSRVYPDFISHVSGKRILDFGCGSGHQSIALAKNGARYVFGLDTNAISIQKGRTLAANLGLSQTVQFGETFEENFNGRFDMVFSQNSMEHFGQPAAILNKMKSALSTGGTIFLTFGPPWFAPYGSHMQYITRLPWVHILFSEKTVMRVRSRHRNDKACTYGDVEGGLNQLSVSEFERIIDQSQLKVKYRKYECIKGIRVLGSLPILRELFINHISVILSRS